MKTDRNDTGWRWFTDTEQFRRATDQLDPSFSDERCLQSESVAAPGWCSVCRLTTSFIIRTGATFDGRPNLREGLVCKHCKLTARQRGILLAMRECHDLPAAGSGAMLERFSRLYKRVKIEFANTKGSEYLSETFLPCSVHVWWPRAKPWQARVARHESITSLSYGSDSLDFLVHTDVLEHVEQIDTAIEECKRVLKPEGVMVFSVPFFPQTGATVQRGYTDADGRVVDVLPPEYHGDGLDGRGIYTFHSFGLDLIDKLRARFSQVEVGLIHDRAQGFVRADSISGAWNMPSIVLRAHK